MSGARRATDKDFGEGAVATAYEANGSIALTH
jgi:hypothetical protein